jgi:O-methyltransferase
MGKYLLKKLLRRLGIDIVRYRSGTNFEPLPPDLSEDDRKIIQLVRPFTMTSIDRLIALIGAVRYIVRCGIAGDIAECGVWRGGSMMAVALTLMAEKDMTRHLYLYDTFEGMSEPTTVDKSFDGTSAKLQLDWTKRGRGAWCYCGLEEVKANLSSIGYPSDHLSFIKGKVEETIPQNIPRSLALLRLDTDWYESTKHELHYLFPLINERGMLILDDYGYWQGAKLAVDEYFATQQRRYFFHRIDFTGRMIVKC